MAHRIFRRSIFSEAVAGRVTLDTLDRGRNNFSFLRCFLALLVIFDHSFLLLPQSGVPEPITHLTRGQMTAGSWAVQGFFLSGFLIA